MSDTKIKPKYGRLVVLVLVLMGVFAVAGWWWVKSQSKGLAEAKAFVTQFATRVKGASGPRVMEVYPDIFVLSGKDDFEAIIKSKKLHQAGGGYLVYDELLTPEPEVVKKAVALIVDWDVAQPTWLQRGYIRRLPRPDFLFEWVEKDGTKLRAVVSLDDSEVVFFMDGKRESCTLFKAKELKALMSGEKKHLPGKAEAGGEAQGRE